MTTCTHKDAPHILVTDIDDKYAYYYEYEKGNLVLPIKQSVPNNLEAWADTPVKNGIYYMDIEAGRVYLCKAAASTSTPSAPHTHYFVYKTIYEPTETMNGTAGMVCNSCGYVEPGSTTVIPMEYAIIYNRYQQIDAAKSGQTIKLEMGEMNSFSQEFMTKIANKTAQNVSFLIHFTYNHVRYEVSIPAGTAVDTTSCVWYGPEKMMQLYSTTEVK